MKIRRVDFSADEWLAGTAELSDQDRGVYITICALIYSRGGPISIDLLRAASRSHGNRLNSSISRLAELGKITINSSEIAQKRCGKELEIARKRIENASEKGKKGGRPSNKNKGLKKAGVFPAEKLTINKEPSTLIDSGSLRSPESARDAARSDDIPAPPPRAKSETSRPRPPPDRGHRLPEDWQPSDADRAFAVSLGLDPEEAADEFRDYWLALPGSRARKLDWSRTYQNRCRELSRRMRKNVQRRRSPVENLYLGAMLAADALDRRDAERAARESGPDRPPPLTLLDGGRSG